MKNLLSLTIMCLLLLSGLAAQQTQIVPPAAVQTAFQDQYPEIEHPFWELREGAVVALFKEEDQLTKVFYERNGKWRETRERTLLTKLPEAVQSFVGTHFEDAEITYAGIVTAPWQEPLYRIESEIQDAIVIKLLDEGGLLIQQERIEFNTEQLIPVAGKE